MTLLPEQWTTLIDAIRTGAVRRLYFNSVDFSALDSNAFLEAAGSRGLQVLMVRSSVVPSCFVTDDLIRTGVAEGVHALALANNESNMPHRVSDEAILDFFFRADAAPGRRVSISLDDSGVTDMFVSKFLEVCTLL